jgi:hypothetical protein
MRGAISYLNFDLLVRRTEGGYRAQVLSSSAGEATADFTLPFSELELENFLLRVGRPRRGTRRIGSPEMEAVRNLGKGLYDAVFSGDVRACWRSSLSHAEAQKAGLRLRLRIADAPELNDIPWEYLYNASLNRFLSLSEYTPLIRYLDLPEHIRPLAVDARLEILVMISSPTDYPGLDVENEWSRLNEALAGCIGNGQVRLERLAEARLSALQGKLRGAEYHILHFIGHGGFDRETQDGLLILCDETGRGRRVAAEHLGTILHDHRSLRLVVLNACEGSRSSRADPFAGVAQTLVQQGVPAVIAMQFEITDQAAIIFSKEFYAATADSYPVDAALSAARKAIFAAGNEIEWGTPVLYLRAPDGRLFSVNRDGSLPQQSANARAARQAEEEKLRGADRGNIGKQFRLTPSFESGIYGGFIGGGFAGLFIGVGYFFEFRSSDPSINFYIIPQLLVFCAISGMLLGAFPQLFILWFDHLATEKQRSWLAFNAVSGGLLGGAISGIPIGVFGVIFFGSRHDYFVGPELLVTGSVLGTIFVTVGALFYAYRGQWRNVTRAFITSLLITACTTTVAIVILQHVDIAVWFFFGTTDALMTVGGAILGGVIGMVMGAQIGLTLSLYRLWEATE